MQEQSPGNQHLTSFPIATSLNSQYPENGDSHHHQRSPPNPDGSVNLGIRSREQQQQDHHPSYDPPPIDFTGYQIDRQRQPSQPQQLPLPGIHDQSFVAAAETQHRLSPFSSSNSRKRSYSNTERDEMNSSTPESARTNRLSSISSILNPAQQQREDMPIDPSLSAIGQQALRHSQTPQQQYQQLPQLAELRGENQNNVDLAERRAQRKAQLYQEIIQTKERLLAQERELEELDGEG